MKDPLLAPLIAVATGILVSRYVRFEPGEALCALIALSILTLAGWRRGPRLGFGAVLVTLCALGIYVDVLHRPKGIPSIDASSRETVIISGCVVDPPIFYESRDQFTLELAPHASARVSLTVREGDPLPDLVYGQIVEFEAKLRPIRNFQNPGAFDFAGYSARRDIFWNASVRAGEPIRMLPGRCGSRMLGAVFGLRTLALSRIESLYPGNPYAIGMMEAILIGETTKMEKIWTDHFRRTGTFHALVISGMHISVLAGTLLFLMRLLFVPEMMALLSTALAAWLYAMVAGWSAPAVRAAGGFTLYLVGRYFFRRRRLMNLLAAVGLGYLLYDPGQMFESSFQLSFLSVAAIAALAVPLLESTSGPYSRGLAHILETSRNLRLAPKVARFRLELHLLAETVFYCVGIRETTVRQVLAWLCRLGLYVYDMVAISAVVQIGLALPMAIYFHRISVSGLSANVVIVPLLSLVIPIGFFAVFTGWQVPALVAGWLLNMAEKVAAWHLRWEPDWRVPDPPGWLSVAFVAALLLLTAVIRRWPRWSIPATAVVLMLFGFVFSHPFAPKTSPGMLEISTIDVGQGDGILVVFPDGKSMMVDGGGFPNWGNRKTKSRLDIGEDVISPYLWSRSIKKLDVVACTHAHEDHTGGVGALIDNFHPDQLWTGANSENEVWRSVEAKALAKHVKIQALRCCQAFDFGGARIEVLAPSADYEPRQQPANNDSLVMKITYGQHSVLLTGDMEKQVEAQLVADGKLSHVDILKVPHHGSKTSSTQLFLDAVQPGFAIISDGFENSFRHPHPDVVERLKEHRAAIFRTDEMGMITIRSDGVHFWMETNAAQPRGPVLSY